MKLKITSLFLLLLCAGFQVKAQEPALMRTDRRPVAVDDINGERIKHIGNSTPRQHIGVSDLTDEQKQQIRTVEISMQRTVVQVNNQLAEKQARQHTLEAQDKPDMKAINRCIDEQVKLIADKLKAEAEFKQKVRTLLTEEQRVEFDSKVQHRHY